MTKSWWITNSGQKKKNLFKIKMQKLQISTCHGKYPKVFQIYTNQFLVSQGIAGCKENQKENKFYSFMRRSKGHQMLGKKHGGSIDTAHLSRSICMNIKKQKQHTKIFLFCYKFYFFFQYLSNCKLWQYLLGEVRCFNYQIYKTKRTSK